MFMESQTLAMMDIEMKCEEVEQAVFCYLDGELEWSARRAFEAHLSRCEACRALLEENTEMLRVARSLSEQAIPEQVQSRLRKRLSAELGIDIPLPRPSLVLIKGGD